MGGQRFAAEAVLSILRGGGPLEHNWGDTSPPLVVTYSTVGKIDERLQLLCLQFERSR